MVNPCPHYAISTPYWKSGSSWSCGYHDGVDYAAPAGTPVVSAWPGTVVESAYPTSFGPAFGRAVVIDHDPLPDGSPGGWGLYAHLSEECVNVGERVGAGQRVGAVGTTGNSSGNHLHFAVYMSDHWTSCGGVNPTPWISAEGDIMDMTYDYLEKPGGSQTFGRSYGNLDQSKWDSPRKGWESTLVYLNITPTFRDGKSHGAVRVRLMRENGDGHDPFTIPIDADDLDDDGVFTTHYHTYEMSESGRWTQIQLKCIGGMESVHVSTRYTTKVLLSED